MFIHHILSALTPFFASSLFVELESETFPELLKNTF
jgi:hypothetical protein